MPALTPDRRAIRYLARCKAARIGRTSKGSPMFTRSEKIHLGLTVAFLAAGSGIKAWRQATVRIGPFPDPATLAQDSVRMADSLTRPDPSPAAGADPAVPDPSMDEAGGAAREPQPGSAGPEAHPGGAAQGETSAGAARSGKIDLNRADAAALMRLNGVGAKTAEAILAWRRAHGPFRALGDLLNIKGIGRKKLEKLAPQIIL